MTLGAYLEQGGRRRRQPGEWDCCTFPADWAVLCGHPDPMAEWRGTYSTEVQAEHLIADAAARGEAVGHGGLEHLFVRGMWAAGIPEIDGNCASGGANPPPFLPGDMAVVVLAGNEAGAIYTGKRWAFVPDRGLGLVSLDRDCIARAWRPYRYHG